VSDGSLLVMELVQRWMRILRSGVEASHHRGCAQNGRQSVGVLDLVVVKPSYRFGAGEWTMRLEE
jgi:hypothetical protein